MPPPACRPLPTARTSKSPSRETELPSSSGRTVSPRSFLGQSFSGPVTICKSSQW